MKNKVSLAEFYLKATLLIEYIKAVFLHISGCVVTGYYTWKVCDSICPEMFVAIPLLDVFSECNNVVVHMNVSAAMLPDNDDRTMVEIMTHLCFIWKLFWSHGHMTKFISY